MAEARDPLRYFRIEARELVDQISAAVLDLDQEPAPDLVALAVPARVAYHRRAISKVGLPPHASPATL